ncbi:MAG TPA: hypothetical protein VGS61_02540 [Acidimicrobiales bacterium]|nr:hypothetical protein [Acidimicrobiales bacterium]
MSVRSFDRPSPRPAPASIEGTDLDGRAVSLPVTGPTLVVAVKEDCDGCRAVVEQGVAVPGVSVVVVAERAGALAGARGVALVAPAAMAELGLRWPPTYVLIHPEGPRVVGEGSVFSPDQVAAEVVAALG